MNRQIQIFIFLVILTVFGTVFSYQYRFRDLVLIRQAEKNIYQNKEKGFKLLEKASRITSREKSIKKIIELYLQNGGYKELIPILKRAIEKYPSTEYLHYLVNSFIQIGDLSGAREYLLKSNLTDDVQGLKQDYLITLNIKLEDYDQAEKILQEKIKECIDENFVCRYFDKDDPYYDMMLERANILSLKNKPAEAIKIYTKLLIYYPDNLELKKKLGDLYLWEKDFLLAVEYFKNLHKKYPDDEYIEQRYIQSLTWSGLKSDLLSVLQTIQNKTKYKKYLSDVIGLYMEKGDLVEAENQLKGFLRDNPSHLDFRLRLAEVLAWQSKFNESINEYELILDSVPDNNEIRRSYAQVLSWMGEHQRAVKEIKKTLNGGLDE